MNIKGIISLFLCTAICSTVITGCGQKSEIPNSDIAVDSSFSSERQTSIEVYSENSEMSRSTVFSQTTVSNSSSSIKSNESSLSSTSQSTLEVSSAPQSETTSSDVHQHNYIKKVVEPTCSEVGYTVYTCSCGEQYTDNTVSALGHDCSKSTVKPTCTSNGYTLYTCNRCGYNYKDDFTEALGHNYTSKQVNPTCTEGGYTTYTCSRCGKQYNDDYQSAMGHKWSEWTTVKEATTVSEGEQRRECSRCGETQSKSIPKIENDEDYATMVVNIVNSERKKYGLSPVTINSTLSEYAQLRSTEIVDNFAHERPDGSSPLNYVMSLGGIHTAGENIAGGYSTPEEVMNAWMNSAGHRKNILNSNFTMIGVGCYKSNGRLYWTQIFAG